MSLSAVSILDYLHKVHDSLHSHIVLEELIYVDLVLDVGDQLVDLDDFILVQNVSQMGVRYRIDRL